MLALVSSTWYSVVLASVTDVKRAGAILSILHMNVGIVMLLSDGVNAAGLTAELWLAHSLGAMA
jgi:hypothetical protein